MKFLVRNRKVPSADQIISNFSLEFRVTFCGSEAFFCVGFYLSLQLFSLFLIWTFLSFSPGNFLSAFLGLG
jgi:hypothetical protein